MSDTAWDKQVATLMKGASHPYSTVIFRQFSWYPDIVSIHRSLSLRNYLLMTNKNKYTLASKKRCLLETNKPPRTEMSSGMGRGATIVTVFISGSSRLTFLPFHLSASYSSPSYTPFHSLWGCVLPSVHI